MDREYEGDVGADDALAAPRALLSRRGFLGLAACGAAMLALAGCAPRPVVTEDAPEVSGDGGDVGASADGPAPLRLFWLSDVHIRMSDAERLAHAPEYLRDVFADAAANRPDAVLIDGDLIDGYGDLDVYASDRAALLDALSTCPVPLLLVRGNHDDNSFYASNISADPGALADVVPTATIADTLIIPATDDAAVFDADAPHTCYYYRDFAESRIRMVVLDDSDNPYTASDGVHLDHVGLNFHSIGARQIQWLAEVALAMPQEDWAVVIAVHVNLCDTRPYGLRAWGSDQPVTNEDVVRQLLQAFCERGAGRASGTVPGFEVDVPFDFTGNGSDRILCHLNGHTHRDQAVFLDGCPQLTVRSFTTQTHGRYDLLTIDRAGEMLHTRAQDTVDGLTPDWDIDLLTGAGIPDTFDFYWSGTTTDGLTVSGPTPA